MELNREQIIKALECCSGTEDDFLDVKCNECTYKIGDTSCRHLDREALFLIKELIEENEKIGIDNFNLICELSRIKEDTVWKMVEGLDKHFYHDHAFRGVELRLINDIIGRVVKELLEDST